MTHATLPDSPPPPHHTDRLPTHPSISSPNPILTGPVRSTLIRLAMPVLAEQLLNMCVGLFDMFLAGRISASATSAVGIAVYVGWLAALMVMLVGIGTTALVSRNIGAGLRDEANAFANQSVTLASLLGVIQLLLLYALAPWFARYCRMTDDAFVITVDFLRIDCFGHMCVCVTLVGCAALRGAGNMKTPLLVFAIMNVVNMVLSASLVYGVGPFPKLGVNGIVTGTVVAQTLGAIITFGVLFSGRYGLRLSLALMRLRWERTSRLLRIGIPAGIDGATMWIGQFLYIGLISNLAPPPLGTAYFAAHIIAVRVEAFTYLPATAWAAAVATMIGQALGARDPVRAKRVGVEGAMHGALVAIAVGVGFYIFAEPIFAIMSADPQVAEVGAGPFRFLALLQPLQAVSIILVGGLRGAGDTRFPLLITCFGTVVIRLSFGYLFGVVCNGGLLGAWVGMFADMIWRAVISTVRFARGKWLSARP